MNITKNYNERELTLAVDGSIETTSSKELENAINSEIGNFDSLILDFADVNYISSAGLRILVLMQKKFKKINTQMIIKNVDEEVKKVFSITGFDKILNFE